jgi:hypothetical protein
VSERSLLDRFLVAIPVLVAGLLLLGLYFWQAAARKTPTIFTDELEWSQISRAIADTGHAARRGQPISFKSLYAYLIAPAWWIHATPTAYAVAKYIGTVTMCLAAIPVYLMARLQVSARGAAIAALGTLCTSALFYAGYLLPETLAYPTFTLCAYASVRALAGGGRRWIVTAIVLGLIATRVRSELTVGLAALALAAAILFVVGPRGRRLRARWTWTDYAGAVVLLVGLLVVGNQLASDHVQQWHAVTNGWQHRLWTLGLTSASALAIGLGLLPMICGLASLWIPERRHDPHWRAFAAYTASAILFFWLYTAVKATYLSITVFTRIEERNLIYLGPLLLVGTVVYFSSRRPWLPATLAATALTAWLVLHYGYQLDYPYFESPGYGVAALANRGFRWDQHDIRIALAVACVVALGFALVPFARRLQPRLASVALAVVALATATWMLAGEITSANGAATTARHYYDNLPQPVDWIDADTGSAGATFIGQNLTAGQDLGINLLEFWNRSVKNIWSLDGSAPGPGPVTTPDLRSRNGRLSSDPGLPYVVLTNGVDLIGTTVDTRPNTVLKRIDGHPWRLRQTTYGVSDDGWISGVNGDATSADGAYAYFGPGTSPGLLKADVGRSGFCPNSGGTNAVVRIGPVALNEQRAAVVRDPIRVLRFHVDDCTVRHIRIRVRPPVAVQIHVSPLTLGTDYGIPDSRLFGVRVGFSFTPSA